MTSISPTTLLFIRHGETDANANGQLEGATDKPLNAAGQAQAQAVAARLVRENRPIQAIYSSSLTRARQTAAPLAAALGEMPVQVDPDLSEFHLGEWDGLTLDELRNEKQMWARMARDPHFAPPGGESPMHRVMRRIHGELFWCHVSGRALDASDPHAAGIWSFEDLSARRVLKVEFTGREREIAALLIEGHTSKQIGKKLLISPRTVDVYRARLMRKMGASTTPELVHRLLSA